MKSKYKKDTVRSFNVGNEHMRNGELMLFQSVCLCVCMYFTPA